MSVYIAPVRDMHLVLNELAGQMDRARRHPDPSVRQQAQVDVDFLTPVVKGWSTESAVEIASTGIRVQGGGAFIEEIGACQYYRDARITTIYEGTTGILANDLIGRKRCREMIPGATAKAWLDEVAATATDLAPDVNLGDIGIALRRAVGAVPYLKLTGIVAGGWLMAPAARIAQDHLAAGSADDFYRAKLATARYFAAHVLSPGGGAAGRHRRRQQRSARPAGITVLNTTLGMEGKHRRRCAAASRYWWRFCAKRQVLTAPGPGAWMLVQAIDLLLIFCDVQGKKRAGKKMLTTDRTVDNLRLACRLFVHVVVAAKPSFGVEARQ